MLLLPPLHEEDEVVSLVSKTVRSRINVPPSAVSSFAVAAATFSIAVSTTVGSSVSPPPAIPAPLEASLCAARALAALTSSSSGLSLVADSSNITVSASPTDATNAWRESSAAVGLSLGSFLRQSLSQSMRWCDHFIGCCSVGGGAEGMRSRTRTTGRTSQCGGSICATSMMVIPKLHKSAFSSYWPS